MSASPRIDLLDIARGIALVAMTVFHFAFDLELFGFQEPGFISQPHWVYFARAIASSFLFLTGFSLFLAHGSAITWARWKPRMVKIVAAALLISVATYFATPEQYIFYGILHAIAFASLAGLLFLKLPVVLIVACAVAVFAIGKGIETVFLDHWIFWWTGLSATPIISSDYVPVFPWFSAPLLGIATAKLAMSRNLVQKLAVYKAQNISTHFLKILGRNSLVYYLLHQPVLISLIFAVKFIAGI